MGGRNRVTLHDRERSALFLGGISDDGSNFITKATDALVIPFRRHVTLTKKSLQEKPVHPILRRPVKVPITTSALIWNCTRTIYLCTVLGLRDENRCA